MKKRICYFALILATFVLVGCTQKQTDKENDSHVKTDTVQPQKPSIDSLLKGVVRASEMELPMLWTDTIYDTCYSSLSSDGKYIVFVGRTEEDKVRGDQHLIAYGPLSEEGRVSVFLYDNEEKAATLLATSNKEGLGLYEPQIDIKNEYVYYYREDHWLGMSLFRYCLQARREECLTGCVYYTTYTLLPEGNILFQEVREDVAVWDSAVYNNKDDVMIGWLGYVFCDIEMSSSGVCTKKSKLYTYYGEDRGTLTYDLDDWGIINNDSLQQKWIDSLQETQYFNKRGECVGVTSNSIESYDGWRGLKPKKQQ